MKTLKNAGPLEKSLAVVRFHVSSLPLSNFAPGDLPVPA
jgi:hypothetical protein